MSNLKDFKNEADEIMNYIMVSNELKEKTLIKSQKRRSVNRFLKPAIVPAVCLMILLVSASLNRYVFNRNIQNPEIMTTLENSTLPISPDEKKVALSRTTTSVRLRNLDEMKKYMGDVALIPSYLPDGFKLKGIQAVSYNNDERRSVWMEYVSGEESFVISIEQESEWKSFEGYEDVVINGLEGHMKSFKDNSYESSEIRWFKVKSMYSVEGAISEEEAIKVARSLN